MQIATMDLDLIKLSIPSNNRKKPSPRDHELRSFFMSRPIEQKKVAEVCNTNESYMSMMLRGVMYMPPEIEERLYQLRDKVVAWEKENGRLFNTDEVSASIKRKAIKR